MNTAKVDLLIRAHSGLIRQDLKRIQALTSRHFSQMRRRAMRTFAGVGLVFDVTHILRGIASVGLGWARYEESLSNVQAKTNALKRDLTPLREEIKKVAAETKFTLKETGDAAGYLAMAGLELKEIHNAISPVLNLAAATQTTAEEAADIVTNVATPLKLLDKDLVRVGDVLALTTASANVNLTEMGHSFSYAASTLAPLNLSMEEGAAMIGLLGNAGVKGSRGGTFFRQSLAALAKGSIDAKDSMDGLHKSLDKQNYTLKRLGVTVKDQNGDVRNFIDILSEMGEAGAKAGDYIDVLGLRAGTTAVALVNQGVPAIRQLAHELNYAEGAMDRMAKTQLDNFMGGLLILRSAAEITSNAFSESGLGGMMWDFANWLKQAMIEVRPAVNLIGYTLTYAFRALGKALQWVGSIVKTVVTSPQMFPAFAVLVGVVLISKVKAAVIMVLKLASAIRALILANPVVAFAVAIALLVGLLMKHSNQIVAFGRTIWGYFENLGITVSHLFDVAIVSVKNAFVVLKNIYISVFNVLLGAFGKYLRMIAKVGEYVGLSIDVSGIDKLKIAKDDAVPLPSPKDPGNSFNFSDELAANLAAVASNESLLDSFVAKAKSGLASITGVLGFAPGPVGGVHEDALPQGSAGPDDGLRGNDSPQVSTEQNGTIAGMFSEMMTEGQRVGTFLNDTFATMADGIITSMKDGTLSARAAFSDLLKAGAQMSSKFAKIYQKLAIADAIWSTYKAMNRALATVQPYPKNIIAAALIGVKGFLNVQKIKSTNVAQAHGGLTNVPKTGSYYLEKGERVTDRNLNVDLKGFLKQEREQTNTKQVFLESTGMYSGDDLAAAFDGDRGTVILQSDVR